MFPLGKECEAFDAEVTVAANDFYLQDAKKAAMCVKKMLKCGGCGALLEDTAAFQEHCGEVEHDDDFGYECSEVEIEVDGAQDVDAWHSFYNTSAEPLSTLFQTSFTHDGVSFRSLEHYLQLRRYAGYNDELAAQIRDSDDPLQAQALGEFGDGGRPDWDKVREGVLLQGLQALVAQQEAVRGALLATQGKPLRAVGAGKWLGVVMEGATAKGDNALGTLLERVRADLQRGA